MPEFGIKEVPLSLDKGQRVKVQPQKSIHGHKGFLLSTGSIVSDSTAQLPSHHAPEDPIVPALLRSHVMSHHRHTHRWNSVSCCWSLQSGSVLCPLLAD